MGSWDFDMRTRHWAVSHLAYKRSLPHGLAERSKHFLSQSSLESSGF